MPTYLFPGQGSQIKGMGGGLFSQFPETVAKANAILGYSVETLCLEDPEQKLNQTQYTQPALYVVNALSYYKKTIETGKAPSFAAGHSLGEYNALLAAGVFDFETGLKLVKKRGELMSQAVDGGMAAIIGLQEDVIKTTLRQSGLQNVVIANYNTHLQMVISGKAADIAKAQIILEQAGASIVVPLKVSGAFHSPYMSLAQKEFEVFLNGFHFSAPSVPVIANSTARPYQIDTLLQNLAQQIVSPVRWKETVQYLMEQNEIEFEELGSGTVLTGLLSRIKNGQ